MSDPAEKWPASKVRQTFIDFFKSKGHTFAPSSPSIPYSDPTLLFTSAGMVQFKDLFLGQTQEGSPLHGLKRAANSQKCIRAGGKHNDLDDVGFDGYHHTFFEMLGNWSFGDFFKEEAIEFAWELLTKVYGLDPERLYATYFEGDDSAPMDAEARDLWLRKLPADRVLPGNAKDNFWAAGDTGPCGPCSELHYDRVGGRNCAELVNADDENVIEVWNLVFMQFQRGESGEMRPLPARSVDTGMGLERLVSVLQDRPSNYETDVFTPLFAAIQAETGARPYSGRFGKDDADGVDMAYRVVADHIRTLTIAITDGCVPSSTGRGYVLRRILRRGVRYGNQFLNGAKPGFFSRLAPAVVESLGDAFPELHAEGNAANVVEVLADEEHSFNRTLAAGVRKFNELADQGAKVIDGEAACVLYDTFGFPVDLTELMAKERGLEVDMAGFEAALERRREISRRAGGGDDAAARLKLGASQTAELERSGVEATDDSAKYDWKTATAEGCEPKTVVRAIFDGAAFADAAEGGATVGVVLGATCFYAEAGGQVGDVGEFTRGGERVFEARGTQRFGGYVLHAGRVPDGARLAVGDEVRLVVDYAARALTAKNHSATHMLNFALREVLGAQCDQKGSLVDPDKARFDFSHKKPVSPKQLAEVQAIVQRQVDARLAVDRAVVPLADAQKIKSLRAMFGEKYPDPVRVVCVGGEGVVRRMIADPENDEWNGYSVEFCGGTHLDNSAEAGRFAIVSEEGIAKGIRRVVALTHGKAAEAERLAASLAAEVAAAEAAPADDALVDTAKDLRVRVTDAVVPVADKADLLGRLDKIAKKLREVVKARQAAADTRAGEVLAAALDEFKDGDAPPFFVHEADVGGQVKSISALLDQVAARLPATPALVVSVDPDAAKLTAIAQCPGGSEERVPANKWIAAAVAPVGGKGGGKPKRAQGAAKGSTDAAAVVEAAVAFVRQA